MLRNDNAFNRLTTTNLFSNDLDKSDSKQSIWFNKKTMRN